jgi:hypothetical protein
MSRNIRGDIIAIGVLFLDKCLPSSVILEVWCRDGRVPYRRRKRMSFIVRGVKSERCASILIF